MSNSMEPKGGLVGGKVEKTAPATTLAEALQREGLEGFPPVEMSFAFGAHLTKNDARALRQQLIGIDVALFEEYGWSPYAPDIYDDLSRGKYSLKSAIEDLGYKDAHFIEFNTEFLRTLQQRGSSLYVHPFDMPQSHASYEKYRKVMEANVILHSHLLLRKVPTPSYEDAQRLFVSDARMMAAEGKEREEIAVQLLPRILAKAAARRPSFLKNSVIKVLVIYGAVHASIGNLIAQKYPDVKIGERYMDPNPKLRSPVGIYVEKLANNDPNADESLPGAFRYLVTTIIAEKLYEHTSGSNAAKYSEEITSALSDADLRALYEQFVMRKDKTGATEKLNSLLAAKGLPSINDPEGIKNFYKSERK